MSHVRLKKKKTMFIIEQAVQYFTKKKNRNQNIILGILLLFN